MLYSIRRLAPAARCPIAAKMVRAIRIFGGGADIGPPAETSTALPIVYATGATRRERSRHPRQEKLQMLYGSHSIFTMITVMPRWREVVAGNARGRSTVLPPGAPTGQPPATRMPFRKRPQPPRRADGAPARDVSRPADLLWIGKRLAMLCETLDAQASGSGQQGRSAT
jgi:hypothetical protein